MAEKWGPWIQHDGKGCPVVGMYVCLVVANGETYEGIAEPGCDNPPKGWASAWVWASVPGCDSWARVMRYRVRRPNALRRLIDMAEDPLKGLPPRFPVEELA